MRLRTSLLCIESTREFCDENFDSRFDELRDGMSVGSSLVGLLFYSVSFHLIDLALNSFLLAFNFSNFGVSIFNR